MTTITVQKVMITGKQLKSLPPDELILLVHSAHLLNTIQILEQMLIYTGRTPRNEAENKACVTQNTLFIRMLASIEFEGWQMLEKSFEKKLSSKYETKLGKLGTEGLVFLRKYFGEKNNVAYIVRNKFGFHFDRPKVADEITRIEDDGTYDLFLSSTRGNSLYYLAEEVAGMAMLSAIQKTRSVADVVEANKLVCEDIVQLSKHFGHFLGDIMSQIIVQIDLPKPSPIDVSAVPLLEVKVPYFVVPPKRGETVVGRE